MNCVLDGRIVYDYKFEAMLFCYFIMLWVFDSISQYPKRDNNMS